ncbi:NAD(P)H-dependent oxidoreductase [Methylobacillus caricis]|uniref:FMN-dependent NADH-azoreductase n=1 Tax=Methylobacillus caricis TaxID=1971611 RepID=UPI001D001A34|nr:NAD(P)H-dependent oxidoreductase [Methylobacillus caricis]MCB5186473.1 NAD(P)H-dependent oxidoreductase [Methylobacillus caricis]
MSKVLVLTCSPHGQASSGWPVVESLLDKIRDDDQEARIVYRSLSAPGFSFPPAAYASAVLSGAPATAPEFAVSETLISELETADMLVISTPMHNFTVPASLKAWIDYVLRIHRTFTPTPSGKVGNLGDIPTFVIVSSGGFHHGVRANQPDFLSPYLSFALETIGIMSIQYIYLQGLAYGKESVEAAIDSGNEKIRKLLLR